MPPTFVCAIHFDYITSHENKFKLFNFIIFFSMHKTLKKTDGISNSQSSKYEDDSLLGC